MTCGILLAGKTGAPGTCSASIASDSRSFGCAVRGPDRSTLDGAPKDSVASRLGFGLKDPLVYSIHREFFARAVASRAAFT